MLIFPFTQTRWCEVSFKCMRFTVCNLILFPLCLWFVVPLFHFCSSRISSYSAFFYLELARFWLQFKSWNSETNKSQLQIRIREVHIFSSKIWLKSGMKKKLESISMQRTFYLLNFRTLKRNNSSDWMLTTRIECWLFYSLFHPLNRLKWNDN